MKVRGLRRWMASLLLVSFAAAHAQELPLLEPDAAFSSAGCYSFLPRCFVFAEHYDNGSAVTSTTASTVAVHTRTGTAWTAQQAIANPDYPSPPTQFSPPRRFGFPSGFEGNSLFVAGTSPKYAMKDVIYAFARSAGAWRHVRTLSPPRPADYFATIVTDIAVSGNHAAVCGVRYREQTDEGAFAQIDIYRRDSNGQWTRSGAITPPTSMSAPASHILALDGDTLVIGNPNAAQSSGQVFVYEKLAAGWTLRKTLTAPASQAGASFGESVAVDANRIVVAAPNFTHPSVTEHGAAFLFERINGVWQQVQQILAPPDLIQSDPNERFAIQVQLSGDRLLIDFDAFEEGSPFAYLYEHRSTWKRVAGVSVLGLGTHTTAIDGNIALVNVSTGFSTQGYSVTLPALGTLPVR